MPDIAIVALAALKVEFEAWPGGRSQGTNRINSPSDIPRYGEQRQT